MSCLWLLSIASTVWPATTSRVADLAVRSEAEGRYRIVVKYQGTPTYTCRLGEKSGAEEVLLEFPATDSALKPEYQFPGFPLGTVTTTPLGGGDLKGVRLEFPLRGATLRGWEVTAEGLEIVLQTTAVPQVPQGGAYVLGVGDRMELAVFGQDDLKQTLEVTADGTVIFPMIGVLPVSGRTLAAVRAEVEKRLKDFLVDPQVSLDIKDYQSQPVNVVGEVEKPGTYYLKGPTTLMDIMAQAGWMTKDAGGEIVLTRHESSPGSPDGSKQITVMKDELLRGGSEFNPKLEAGDVITVGPQQYFYIRGEVVKPGQYPLGDHPTLLKAMSIAEGLTPYAKKKDIQIIRTTKAGQTKLTFDLKSIEERKTADAPLMPGDIIIVARRLF